MKKERPMQTIDTILVPTDFADCSKRALALAYELAGKYGARIELLHVWLMPAYVPPSLAVSIAGREEPIEALATREAEALVAQFLAGVENRAHIPVETKIVHGVPEEVIVEYAKRHDLVVMGTHGRRGIAHFALGSVAEKVVRACTCPVLVVNERCRGSFK